MDVIECINNRRSIRTYTDEVISKDLLHELITLGTKAATGSNEQPWGFLAIQDEDEINQLSEEIKASFNENMDSDPALKRYQSWMSNPKFHIFNKAKTVLAIYGNTNSGWYVYDCSLAAGNIMLAAETMNIGTCWVGFAGTWFNSKKFKDEHNVPAEYELVSTLSMGYKAKQLPPSIRKEPVIF